MKVKFELTNGIVSGCTKRLLEQHNTGIVFTQRKSYDEYYSKAGEEVEADIELLSFLSEGLSVEIHDNIVILTERF